MNIVISIRTIVRISQLLCVAAGMICFRFGHLAAEMDDNDNFSKFIQLGVIFLVLILLLEFARLFY